MPIPRLGYLGLGENPTAEDGRALIRQFVLVREADRMGYDDIWLGEHCFDQRWPTAGVVALLGHLAAVASKARIGSMALLPALHDPVKLAQDLATIDLLAKGRFELGAASGAAFPQTLQAFGLDAAEARRLLRDRLATVQGLLAGEALAGLSQTLVPQSAQKPPPIWVAADDEATVRCAAQRGWGLMAAATHTRERVQRAVRLYTEASGGRAPALVLARFACSRASHEDAVAIARPYFEAFAARAQAAGWGTDAQRSVACNVEALIGESLVGSHAAVAARFKSLAEDLGATRVAIIPTSGQFDTHKHILADFVDEVRPFFDE